MRTAPETNASAPGWSITYGAQNPGSVNMDKAGLGFDLTTGNPFMKDVYGNTVWSPPLLGASATVKVPVTVRVALSAAADTAGAILAWANPTGGSIIVTRVVFDVTTASTGACTVDVGVAANATTSNDTIMDGLDVNTAAGTFDNIENQGTNGKSAVKVTSSQYVTASRASGAVAGMVGFAYITFMPI